MTTTLLRHTDDLLRGSDLLRGTRDATERHKLLVLTILIFAPCYGALMGSYRLDSAERWLQVCYSAVKLPILLFATSLICLPGFFVLNSILGLRDDFAEALGAILAGQAGLSVVLAALAPVTRFMYFCDVDYRAALLLNLAAFGIATFAAQTIMRRHYRLLIQRRPYHRLALTAWLVLYSFVGIQMAWTLRPFIGSPGARVTFFREEPFTNAYVVVIGLIFGS